MTWPINPLFAPLPQPEVTELPPDAGALQWNLAVRLLGDHAFDAHDAAFPPQPGPLTLQPLED